MQRQLHKTVYERYVSVCVNFFFFFYTTKWSYWLIKTKKEKLRKTPPCSTFLMKMADLW